jgi:hypothetical protein
VKVVGDSFGFCDKQWLHALGADGDDVVLILQDAFDGEESLAGQQQSVLVKEIGTDDGVGDSGFVFQTDEDESFGGTGALSGDGSAPDPEALLIPKPFESEVPPLSSNVNPSCLSPKTLCMIQ